MLLMVTSLFFFRFLLMGEAITLNVDGREERSYKVVILL